MRAILIFALLTTTGAAGAQTWSAPGACLIAPAYVDGSGVVLATESLPPVRCRPGILAALCGALNVGDCVDLEGRFAPLDADYPGELIVTRLCAVDGGQGGGDPGDPGDGDGSAPQTNPPTTRPPEYPSDDDGRGGRRRP